MLNRPKFRAGYHVQVVDDATVFLLTENSQRMLNGRQYAQLAGLLDGQHSLADLMEALDGKISLPQLLVALNQLESRGYLVEADEAVTPEQAAFWQQLGVDTASARERLGTVRVAVESVGGAEAAPLRSALAQQGVASSDQPAMTVIVTNDYLAPGLHDWNRQALASGKPWMLVQLVGDPIWIGPIFRPGQTACWACLAERLRHNRPVEAFLLRRTGGTGPLPALKPALPTTIELGANLAATEVVKWVVLGENKQLDSRLVTVDAASAEVQTHQVVRRPQCPECGRPQSRTEMRPVRLARSLKHFTADGGHRTAAPEVTYAGYQHHISPLTGVINWLVDLTEEVNGLTYSYGAGHNFALVSDTPYWLRESLRSRTGGKGSTAIQAKVSAMAEAIERYSGVWRGDEPVVRGTFRGLGPSAIPANDCVCISPSQYAERETLNARSKGSRLHVVPRPFDKNQEMDWTPVWSLTHEDFRLVPAAYCYYGHPEAFSLFYCMSDSNGCAAGNVVPEAILQGFMELVERDSVAMWWYNRARRPALDLDSFGLPYLAAVREYYQRLHRELWVLDITADLGIPTFAAISRRVDRPVEDVLLGFAAHLDPKVALLRAVTELNQFLPAVARTAPDGSTRYSFPEGEAIDWWKTAKIGAMPYLVPDASAKTRQLADYARVDSPDLATDVMTCVSLAKQAGLEMLVLDQTRPDIGMNVCRVIVPGMRHFWRRLGPGRLYDVPVRLGWLSSPVPENELNPYSIFF